MSGARTILASALLILGAADTAFIHHSLVPAYLAQTNAPDQATLTGHLHAFAQPSARALPAVPVVAPKAHPASLPGAPSAGQPVAPSAARPVAQPAAPSAAPPGIQPPAPSTAPPTTPSAAQPVDLAPPADVTPGPDPVSPTEPKPPARASHPPEEPSSVPVAQLAPPAQPSIPPPAAAVEPPAQPPTPTPSLAQAPAPHAAATPPSLASQGPAPSRLEAEPEPQNAREVPPVAPKTSVTTPRVRPRPTPPPEAREASEAKIRTATNKAPSYRLKIQRAASKRLSKRNRAKLLRVRYAYSIYHSAHIVLRDHWGGTRARRRRSWRQRSKLRSVREHLVSLGIPKQRILIDESRPTGFNASLAPEGGRIDIIISPDSTP